MIHCIIKIIIYTQNIQDNIHFIKKIVDYLFVDITDELFFFNLYITLNEK